MDKDRGPLFHLYTGEEQIKDIVRSVEAALKEGTVIGLTDHELNLLAAFHSLHQLQGPGETLFKSGAIVRWRDAGDRLSVDFPCGNVLLTDLPDEAQAHIVRLSPEDQRQRHIQLALRSATRDAGKAPGR